MRSFLRSLLARFSVPDEQYVENCRRMVINLDRHRWARWFSAILAVGALLALTGLVVRGILNNIPGQPLGFALGLFLGLVYGTALVKVGHYLGSLLSTGRTERLLVRYHDELEQTYEEWQTAEPTNEVGSAEAETGSFS